MSKEAMKLALEALGWTDEWRPDGLKEQAITALREALASEAKEQPAPCEPADDGVCEALDCSNHTAQQEPEYTWPTVADYERDVGFQTNEAFRIAWNMARTTNRMLGHTSLQPAQQEPFGYFRYDLRLDAWVQNRAGLTGTPFYTSPPAQRTWVGLTDEEITEEMPVTGHRPITSFARAIEAKLKEKNT